MGLRGKIFLDSRGKRKYYRGEEILCIMQWKSKYTDVPVWVNVVHYWMGKLNSLVYYLPHKLDSYVMWKQMNLIDNHCNCSKCKGRYKKGYKPQDAT